MPLTPEQVRGLRPGQWIRFELEGGYIDGKVIKSCEPGYIRIDWDDGHRSSYYIDSAKIWSLCDYHPDYRPEAEAKAKEASFPTGLSLEVFNLLEAAGLSKSVIGRILSLVAFGEAETKADARAIDVLAQSAPEGVSVLSLSDPEALHRAVASAVGEDCQAKGPRR